jgi:predicted nucleic-acid-binding Zn-ribbon protein
MALVAKCEKCSSVDTQHEWASAEDAAKQGAFQRWTCPTCAWTEFDLVEAEEARETAQTR